MSESDPKAPAGGLLLSLQRLLTTLLDIVHTRVAIIATEFEEERLRLRELVVFGVVAMFFVSLGIVLLTLFVVMLFWETNRLYVLGGFALLYLGVGVVAGISLRHRLKSRPRLFATTLAELSKDRDQMTPPQQ
jgi:uncharacterized membrane protein YqjE